MRWTRCLVCRLGKDRFKAILERCRSAHGELTDLMLPVLEEQERQMSIIHRRGTITRDAHRFFLALLLNVPSRKKILELVKQRYPDQDPVETMLDWVEELGRTRVLGSKETNALGMPEFDDSYVFVLECLLQGLSCDEINRTSQGAVSARECRGTHHQNSGADRSAQENPLCSSRC